MPFLCRELGIEPQSEAFAGGFCQFAIAFKLGQAVENDMIGITEQLGKFVLAKGGGKDVALAPRHFLKSEPRLIEPARLGAVDILREYAVDLVV